MKIFRSKVLLRYLLSYFMLLLITVTCVLFSLNLLRQAEYQVMDEGNRLALNRYKAMMDAQWEMIAKTSDMLSLDRSVREQMNITGALSAQRRYEMIQLCRQLSAAVQTNAYSAVREVLLYFPGTQSVVTMESRVSAPLYFENVCRYGEMSGEEAIAALEESWRSKYNILRDVVCVNQATGERSLCVARALDRSIREDSGVVVFLLDEQKMEQIAAECMGVPEECRVYLCDLQGRSLFHSQEDAELAGSERFVRCGLLHCQRLSGAFVHRCGRAAEHGADAGGGSRRRPGGCVLPGLSELPPDPIALAAAADCAGARRYVPQRAFRY